MSAQESEVISEKSEVFRRLVAGDLLTNGRLVGHTQVFYFILDGREVATALTYQLENQADDLKRHTFEWRARRVSILHLAGDRLTERQVRRVVAHLEAVRDRRLAGSD